MDTFQRFGEEPITPANKRNYFLRIVSWQQLRIEHLEAVVEAARNIKGKPSTINFVALDLALENLDKSK